MIFFQGIHWAPRHILGFSEVYELNGKWCIQMLLANDKTAIWVENHEFRPAAERRLDYLKERYQELMK